MEVETMLEELTMEQKAAKWEEAKRNRAVCMQERYTRLKAAGKCVMCRNPLVESDRRRVYCDVCRARMATYSSSPVDAEAKRQWRLGVIDEILRWYGGKCVCCGEAFKEFLDITPVGDAREALSMGKGTWNIYKKLRRLGRPDGFQVLCHNCIIGRKRNGGVCPHKQLDITT